MKLAQLRDSTHKQSSNWGNTQRTLTKLIASTVRLMSETGKLKAWC